MRLFNAPVTRTYPGRKLLSTFAGTFAVCAIGLFYSPRAISVETSEWIDYSGALVLAFWYNHILLLCGIFLVWIALFVFNVAQPAYNLLSSNREIIPHRDIEKLLRFRLFARIIAIGFLGSILLFCPIIWVRGVAFEYLLSALGVIAFVLTLLSSLGLTAKRVGDYKALVRFDFPKCTFDVASLAPVSAHVKRALDKERGRIDIPQLLRDLEFLLKVPNESIRLHSNTTSAYDHALREMYLNGFDKTPPVVLASDAEYPNITVQLEARMSRGRENPIQLITAEIRSLLWQSAPNERIVEEYVRKAKDCGSKVDVVALCHVHHATGRIIPVLDIVGRLEAEGLWSASEGYLLVDGAQAVGNVNVPQEIWNKCDFYAFCGHKWLLGTPTLGALYTRPHPGNRAEWREIPLPAGLSRSCDPNELYGSTANLDSRIALQMAVKDFRTVGLERAAQWNADLADLFREKLPLAEAGLSPIGVCQGGIVTVVAAKDRIQRIATHLADYYGKITCFDDDFVGPGSGRSALRLCFHVFHRREDIYELVQRISDGS